MQAILLPSCLNRTSVGLKLQCDVFISLVWCGLNRTSVGLKPEDKYGTYESRHAGLNRTSVGLKPGVRVGCFP